MVLVLDSNILLAAFGTRGLCEALFSACLGRHQIVISEFIITELQTYLTTKFKVDASRVSSVIELLRQTCVLVEPVAVADNACRDPKDLPILGTALAGKAEVIVTGDLDLLSIVEFAGVRIMSPRQFYDLLQPAEPK